MFSFDYKAFKKCNPFVKNKDIAEWLGVSEGYISKVISGQTQLAEDKFSKLLDHPTWDTSPLLSRAQETLPTYEHPLNLAPTQKPAVVPTATPAEHDNTPAWMPTSTSGEVETIEAEEVPFVEKPQIESREVDIRSYVEGGDAKTIIPQGLVLSGTSFARKIYSDAMAPDIREGDIVLCSFLPDVSSIVDGGIYAVDSTKTGCVIRDVRCEGDSVVLVARNFKYPELRVGVDEIRSVAVPMQLIRSTFSQRTDYAQIIKDKDERIDLLVNREFDHIRHTDKLLEQLDKASLRQDKLIELLEKKH